MSLVKHPLMTEKNLTARRRNGRNSRGAASAAGKERARAANLRHGLYSKERNQALRALGEDPAELAALHAAAAQEWRPANLFQQRVVEQLVAMQWRLERAGRRQDNLAAAHIERAAADRHEKTMAWRYRYVDREGILFCLPSYAQRPDFYAPASYTCRFAKVFAEEMRGGVERILELLHRLAQPADWTLAPGPQPPGASSDSEWEEMRAVEESECEVDPPLPLPGIPVAEGEERAELRAEICQLARQELAALKAAWDPFFDKYMQPLTTAERDEAAMDFELAGKLERLQREEACCFREMFRLMRFLTKMREGQESKAKRSSGLAQDPVDPVNSGEPKVGGGGEDGHDCRNLGSPAPGAGVDNQGAQPAAANMTGANPQRLSRPAFRAACVERRGRKKKTGEFAGATGDIHENKSGRETPRRPNRPSPRLNRGNNARSMRAVSPQRARKQGLSYGRMGLSLASDMGTGSMGTGCLDTLSGSCYIGNLQ